MSPCLHIAPAGRRMSVAGQETRRAICLAAESLIGQRGPEAVTLREIAVAANQRNRSAVPYHFGDKANLINEVIRMRNLEIDGERQALLDAAIAKGTADDVLTLVRCLYQPILSVVDDNGLHPYSRFQLQIIGSEFVTKPIDDRFFEACPARISIIRRIEKAIDCRSDAEFGYKSIMASTIFHSCVRMSDAHLVTVSQFGSMDQALENAYDLMCKNFEATLIMR